MKKILLSALAVVAMASCNKSEDVVTPDVWDGELRISSGIETRASGTNWASGDEIGVFMNLSASNYDAVGTPNTKYTTTKTSDSDTYTSATFKVATGGDDNFTDLYYPQSGNVDIVAHYPYNDDILVTKTTYPVNVSDQSDPAAIDFMSAKMVGVVKSSKPLALEFYHLLSQISVSLAPTTGGGLTADDLKGATVTVSGTVATATATVSSTTNTQTKEEDLSADFGTLITTTTVLSVTDSDTDANVAFIVVPQTATVKFTITLANSGGTYSTEATSLTFASGKTHSYTISVSNSAAAISGATIKPWGDGADEQLTASPDTTI